MPKSCIFHENYPIENLKFKNVFHNLQPRTFCFLSIPVIFESFIHYVECSKIAQKFRAFHHQSSILHTFQLYQHERNENTEKKIDVETLMSFSICSFFFVLHAFHFSIRLLIATKARLHTSKHTYISYERQEVMGKKIGKGGM